MIAGNLTRLRDASLGFEDEGLVRAFLDLRQWGLSADESTDLMRRLADEVARLPEAEAVTRSWILPPVFLDIETRFTLPAADDPEEVRTSRFNLVDGAYFGTLGLETVSGRVFDEREVEGPGTVLVNTELAERLWPGSGPAFGEVIGRSLRVDSAAPADRGPDFRIVGVVESITQHDLTRSAEPILYFSIDQRRRQFGSLTTRTSAPPDEFKRTLREALARVDAGAGAARLETSAERRWDALVVERLQAQSAAILALAGVLLSAAGVFGTMNLLVAARRRELAIRKAVGASDGRSLAWVLAQCGRVTAVGVLLGLAASTAIGRVLQSWLPDLQSPGLGVYAGSAAVLIALSLLSALLPSVRGSRVEAATALRAG